MIKDKYHELGQLAFIKGESIGDCRLRNSERRLAWMRGFKQAQRDDIPIFETRSEHPVTTKEKIKLLRELLNKV